nr:hypothetical protein [Halorussus sp. MSC15.2]
MVPEFGEREQQALQVGVGVEAAGVDDVGDVARLGRPNGVDVDTVGDDPDRVAVRTEFPDAGPDGLGGRENEFGEAGGESPQRVVGVARVG